MHYNLLSQVQVGRIDADQERQLLHDVMNGQTAATQNLPIMALITQKRKSKVLLYEGPHERHAIIEFVRKQRSPPTRRLKSVAEVEAFFQDPRNGYRRTPTTAVAVRGEVVQFDFLETVAAVEGTDERRGVLQQSEGTLESAWA